MSLLLLNKIEELTILAKTEGDPNVQIVLLILSGSMQSGDESLLASKMLEFAKDVLIPRCLAAKDAERAVLN